MNIFSFFVTFLLALFSTAVMSYIAMATPIGPWIAPTLVLIGSLLLACVDRSKKSTALALTTAGGSVGGILATACGFSYPTLYFLDAQLFNQWMAQPWYFVAILSGLALAAGAYGLMIANILERSFIIEQQMAFPIGQLVYKMIAAQNQIRKAWELVIGFSSAVFFSVMQGGIAGLRAFLPKIVTILEPLSFGYIAIPRIQLRFDMLPMLLAIGFITGHVIAIPLIIGVITKLLLINPVNALFFATVSNYDFLLAFCSGMVVIGALQSFFDLPRLAKNFFAAFNNKSGLMQSGWFIRMRQALSITELVLILGVIVVYLSVMRFGFLEQVYLLIFTFICTYQIATIAGKIGMAQLGRFATFVMVPALFLFGIDPVKVTIIATFVEISGGVATDVLFGRKMGYLADIPSKQLKRYQIFGLLISACAVGIIFWLLIQHFGLGSQELFAQRAQARALLISMKTFNTFVLALGCMFGYLLKTYKINPMLVLGGLLMPIDYSLGLILGGCLTFVTKQREEWEPFWSGVFAGNSIMELLKTIF